MHKILVVDDDLDNLVLTRAALERAGFEVVETWEPREAAAIAQEGELDAVVLDLVMPGLSGLEVLKSLRSNPKTAALPILFLSAHAEAADRVRGLREGADDYLGKPFDPDELALRLQRLVTAASSEPESLEGKLEDFALSDVVQTLQQGRKSGFLAVLGAEGVGRLVLRDGEILAASFARLVGGNALLAMFDERQGRFRFSSHETTGRGRPEGSTPFDLHATLLEAAWIADELARRRPLLPRLAEPLMVAGEGEPEPPAHLRELPIRQIYQRVQTLPGLTLGDLLASQWAAPSRTRLAAAWLVEQGLLRGLRD